LGRKYRLIKRAEDLFLLLLVAPVAVPLGLAIALIIRLDSRGSVLFRQKRLGRGGQPFWIYKFRTMRAESLQSSGEVRQTDRDDRRCTRFGKLLRRTSLDELPQLINVLKGEMSVIGPRPHAVSHDVQFADIVPQYCARHRALPGLTGLAQVNGFRGAINGHEAIAQRVGQDLAYIARWSPLLDLQILIRTFGVLIHRNAY
jgi:putative colanic acid biosynthesis UDP-glucose lipid carrier transferase